MMKLHNFYFRFTHKEEEHLFPIQAETLKQAKQLASSIQSGLAYADSYEEVVEQPDQFEGQEIAWICAKPVEELPFPFKQLKQAALLFAYGTDCQCCLGYRIMGALVLGGIVGYLMG